MKVLLAPSLARDPTLITSIRYLATGISYHREQILNFSMSRQKEWFPELCDVCDGGDGCAQKGRPT